MMVKITHCAKCPYATEGDISVPGINDIIEWDWEMHLFLAHQGGK